MITKRFENKLLICIWFCISKTCVPLRSSPCWQNRSLHLLIYFNDERAETSLVQLPVWNSSRVAMVRWGVWNLEAVSWVIRASTWERSGLPRTFSKFSGSLTPPSLDWNAEKISFDSAWFEHGCLFNKGAGVGLVIACYWTCPLLVWDRSPLRCYHYCKWKQVSGGLSHSGTGEVSEYKRNLVLIECFITWKWSAYININRIVHVILF